MIEKDEDGYPESLTWEGLWCSPAPDGFEVLSIPFYLKTVSRGDLVCAVEEQFLRFTKVVRHGGHNTYRLLMHEAPFAEVENAMAESHQLGLTVELNEGRILLAVDVPPSVDQVAIDRFLIAHTEAGRWQMQDGYLGSISTDPA